VGAFELDGLRAANHDVRILEIPPSEPFARFSVFQKKEEISEANHDASHRNLFAFIRKTRCYVEMKLVAQFRVVRVFLLLQVPSGP
jgi:hypothetical protein